MANPARHPPKGRKSLFASQAHDPLREKGAGTRSLMAAEPGQMISGLMAHDLVVDGISVVEVRQVMDAFDVISEEQVYEVLGISAKTMQRRAAGAQKTLDPDASDRALRLISVTSKAIAVLGSLEAAERWLTSPAMGLDRRTPLELLKSSEGTQMVKTLLTRMDYGVYA